MSMTDQLYRKIRHVIQEFDILTKGGIPVCLVIMGADLALLAALRQPGVPTRIEHMAQGKAYTCAKMGCSTGNFHKRILNEQLSLADFMDSRLTSMQGGVPLLSKDGTILAGIGVSGRRPEEDERLALKIRDLLVED